MIYRYFGKERYVMKSKISNAISKVLKTVAATSSETTSMVGLYQPKTPKALIKSEKK
jgi:cyclic lactone autoinducer peptide